MKRIILYTFIAIATLQSIILADIVDYHYTTVKSDYAVSDSNKFIISNAYISNTITYGTKKDEIGNSVPNTIDINVIEKSGYSVYLLTENNATMKSQSNREVISYSKSEDIVHDIDTEVGKDIVYRSKNNYFPNINLSEIGISSSRNKSSGYSSQIDLMKNYLLNASVNFECIIGVYSDSFNRDMMALIVKNGEESILYAIYGVWNNQNEAQKYGYNKGDKIYMSKSKLTQNINDKYGVTKYLIEISNMKNKDDETVNAYTDIQVQGSSVWTKEEVLLNKKGIFPQLVWSTKEICSENTSCKDDNGIIILCTGDDKKVPLAPDDYSYIFSKNKFIPGAENCPDMETYYDLFCECIEEQTNIKPKNKAEKKVEASQYLNYLDYMRTEMYQVEKTESSVKNYDNTVYGPDGYPTSIEVNTESEPTQPYMYDNECNLINKAVPPSTPDYLRPNVKFAMANYKGFFNMFHLQSVEQDAGWPLSLFYGVFDLIAGKMFFLSEKNVKGENITDLVQPCISKGISFYRAIKDTPLEKMSQFGETLYGNDEITFHINSKWKKILEGESDSVIQDVIKRTYIGNPNDRMAPYPNENIAILYEHYYANPDPKQKNNCGEGNRNQPFRIEARGAEYKSSKKINIPVTTVSYDFTIAFSNGTINKDLLNFKFSLDINELSEDNIDLINEIQESAFKNIIALFRWERYGEWTLLEKALEKGDSKSISIGTQSITATKLYEKDWNWRDSVGTFGIYGPKLFINGKQFYNYENTNQGILSNEAIEEILATAVSESKNVSVTIGTEKKDDNKLARHDAKDWYLKWRWPLVIRDKEHGAAIKQEVGWVRYKIKYMSESVNASTNSGSKADANFPATNKVLGMRTWGMKMGEDASEWAQNGYGNNPGDEVQYKEACNYYITGSRSGKDSDDKDHAFNHHLYIISDGWLDGENMYGDYDKNSKDYHTDQYDVSDRDDEIDKGEAIKDIVAHIAVAEALNLSMKLIHYIATKKKQAIPLYEVAKRIENGVTQSTAYDIAVDLYKVYITWKKVMDLLKEVRDTYKRISSAWNGLKVAGNSFIQHYKDLNYKNLRLSNITELLPTYNLYELDMSLSYLNYCINDFENAVDAFAFYSDIITKGNYGPLKPFIWVMTNAIKEVSIETSGKASKAIERNTSQLDNINKKSQSSGGTASSSAYLSNITAGLATASDISELRVRNNQVKALATALAVIEREAKDQLEFKSYMMSLPSNLSTAFDTKEERERPFVSLYNALHHERMFSEDNTRYINNMAYPNK